jgi:hypothetical protein
MEKLLVSWVNFHFSPEFTGAHRAMDGKMGNPERVRDICDLPLILDSHRLLEIEEDSISLFFIEGA